MQERAKILQIGNHPPPMCGWAIQLKLVTEELRRRGHLCEVLKINENRQVKSPDYVDVQDGWDYLCKIWRYARGGYRLNVHVNGQSRKGYLLALAAVLVGRLVNRPTLLTFHGGLSQQYFPRQDSWRLRWAFALLFRMSGRIACDSVEIQEAIEAYGVPSGRTRAIATFSSQYLDFTPARLPGDREEFLAAHDPVFFCYVSFRPEYRLEVMRQGMARFRERHAKAGFIWLGFPAREMPAVEEFVHSWTPAERESLLLLGNLTHDEFLTLMTRSTACLRTPACDGVAASVLEALALGVPVVASENGRRPSGVVTYSENDAEDMCAKLNYLMEHRAEVKASLRNDAQDDNVGIMADWLAGESRTSSPRQPVALQPS
jgi:glycosyltransferase involved in cell wall biosynthesis